MGRMGYDEGDSGGFLDGRAKYDSCKEMWLASDDNF